MPAQKDSGKQKCSPWAGQKKERYKRVRRL